jgi:predicted metal-binding membrane protein
VILGGLAGVTLAAWLYLALDPPGMSTGAASGMSGDSMVNAMTVTHPWAAAELGPRMLMWSVMMVAMMVPTAVPMTLVYAAVARKAERDGRPVAPTFAFVAGYIAIWVLFSVAATAAQGGLDTLSLLSSSMSSASRYLGGGLLIGAGLYELTQLKHACLAHCRAPAHFISHRWRVGFSGAFRMGSALGMYCLGCCWILMGLLFLGGLMNLLWVAAIAAFILLEKTVPLADRCARVVGVGMSAVGALTVSGVVVLA